VRIALYILIAFLTATPTHAAKPTTPISFWNTQKRGTNCFAKLAQLPRFQAAARANIKVIRLAPNQWLNGRPAAEQGDFLIGPADSTFKTIPAKDLQYLKQILDDAARSDIKIVLTMLSLPGSRWSQHNNGIEDRRIWKDFKYQEQAISFWRQLASELKDHPALVGYNFRNEPSPERISPRLEDWTHDYAAWYARVKGTPADLNLFYKKAVQAIRQVDRDTPIVLDSGFYATPWAFKILEPIDDPKVIYSFHMYEPYAFTNYKNHNENRGIVYPGKAPLGEAEDAQIIYWNRQQIDDYLKPIRDWQKKHGIASNRIFAAEFGVYRYNKSAETYLRDVIHVLNKYKWHWAFYDFRADVWHGMNYELGTTPPPAKYWEALERGEVPGDDLYKPNSLWDVILEGLGE